jgi:hypothetical protein
MEPVVQKNARGNLVQYLLDQGFAVAIYEIYHDHYGYSVLYLQVSHLSFYREHKRNEWTSFSVKRDDLEGMSADEVTAWCEEQLQPLRQAIKEATV